MKRLAALALLAITAGGLTACGIGGPDEDGFLEATTYLPPGDEHYWDQLGPKWALEWGYEVCDVLGDEDAEREYAMKSARDAWTDNPEETDGMTWTVSQAAKYLCSEHEGETIAWYTYRQVDAAGLVKNVNGPGQHDWVRYGPEQIDHDARTITAPMLHESEKHWFETHTGMPRSRLGGEVDGVPKPLAGIERFVRIKPLNGGTGEYPPETEKEGTWTQRLVRTIPKADEPVTFEGVTLVTRWHFKEWDNDQDGVLNSQDSTPYGSFSYSGGDDGDDFNVPGWLCPTRFC